MTRTNTQHLTKLELAFCKAYVVSREAKAAAREAGYSPGWQKRAYQILQRPHIREKLVELSRRVEERAVRDGADVVNEIAKIAFLDVTEFLKPDPTVEGGLTYKAPDELTSEQRAAVAQVHISDYEFVAGQDDDGKDIVEIRQSYSYTFHDKTKALTDLGKHFQIFGESPSTNITLNRFSSLPEDVLNRLERELETVIEGEYSVEKVNGSRLPDDRRPKH